MDRGGRWILTGGEDGVVRAWEAPVSVSLMPIMNRANLGIRALAFSPDGSTIVTGNDHGEVVVWDAKRALMVGPPIASPDQILSVAFSPDARVFATAGRKQPIRIFDRRTRRMLKELARDHSTTSIAFRQQDGALLAGYEEGKARLWDFEDGRTSGPELNHGAVIRAVAISPDGRLAVTGGDDRRAVIWSLDSGLAVSELTHPGAVRDLSFAPSSTTLLTGCADKKARLWDVASQRLIREFDHGRSADAVAISPDGRTLAVGGSSRTFSLWDTTTFELIEQRSERRFGLVLDIAYRPDGGAVAIGLGDGTTEYVEVAVPIAADSAELAILAQVISNARLDEAGNLVRRDRSQWSEARKTLAAIRRPSGHARGLAGSFPD